MAAPAPAGDPSLDQPPFEVRQTAEKGMGCFATRDIEAGTIIIEDNCIITKVNCSSRAESMEDFMNNFENLRGDDRDRYLSLYGWLKPDRVHYWRDYFRQVQPHSTPEDIELYIHAYSIFMANAFEVIPRKRNADGVYTRAKGGVFLLASRFNHDCNSNMLYDITAGCFTGYATRQIKKDDEITLSYIPYYGTREDRQEQLQFWGFTCACDRCKQNNETDYDRRLIEARRVQLNITEAEALQWESNIDTPNAAHLQDKDEDFGRLLEQRITILAQLGWERELFFA
ncbi:hypothetical protein F4819DRAFT_504186 [Hypoxylon fuscum]|nr:hypothetical protein F4819DRAFT_504186 [Hypoxylon fuscum]